MPTVTTELEIFDCLSQNLRKSAENCQKLAWDPKRGHIYNDFRKSLKLVEGCCRQIFYWRDYDSRWLVLGRLCNFAHHKAGNWLRNSPTAEMRKIAQPEFKWLGERLEQMHKDVERLRHMATGKMGPIVPEPLPLHRESGERKVQLILPPGFKDRRAA